MYICWYGTYKKDYSRNIIFRKALKREGHTLEEFWVDEKVRGHHQIQLMKLLRQKSQCDVLFVLFPAYRSVLYAKLFSKLKSVPLIYDPLISKYNTYVEDRKKITSSLGKFATKIKDNLIYRIPDHITLDTSCHISYFIERYGLDKDKFSKIPLSTDTEVFYPRETNSKKEKDILKIKFHGLENPLQGIQHIIDAVKILRNEEKIDDVQVHLLGKGPTLEKAKKEAMTSRYLKNILFVYTKKIPYTKLPDFISDADIYLGIFGNTIKANMVVPNKVYEAMAMGLPVITRNSCGMKDMGFLHKKYTYLVNPADPAEIADAILYLRDHPRIREKIARNAYNIIHKKFSINNIGKELSKVLDKIV